MSSARPGNALDSVRRSNLAAILNLVHHGGPQSRSQVTAKTGLNRSTVADLITQLSESGLVTESDPQPTHRVGRPSPRVAVHSGPVVIAINPEVDAVTVALVGLGARVLARLRHDVDGPLPAHVAVSVISSLIEKLPLEGHRVVAMGLAVPGLVRASDGIVRWAPHLGWVDVPIARLMTEATGIRAVVANDASLGALAEHQFGAGRAVDDLVYLNGGASGIGGGVIVAGRPLAGAGGYAGEFGHNRPGSADRVNVDGDLEDEVSRARLMAAVGLRSADEETLAATLLGSTDALVLDELARQRRVLSVALSNAINVFNPALVLLGGFLSAVRESDPRDFDNLVRKQAVPAAWADVTISPAGLGADLLMIGAAELAFSDLLANPIGSSAALPPG